MNTEEMKFAEKIRTEKFPELSAEQVNLFNDAFNYGLEFAKKDSQEKVKSVLLDSNDDTYGQLLKAVNLKLVDGDMIDNLENTVKLLYEMMNIMLDDYAIAVSSQKKIDFEQYKKNVRLQAMKNLGL